MEQIRCTKCGATKVKRNGKTRHEQQRYQCKVCSYQFVEYTSNKVISASKIAQINKLLLERLSLRGICRAMDVSLPWLLNHIKKLYKNLPKDLNIITEDIDFQNFGDEQLDKIIYDWLEKKKNP